MTERLELAPQRAVSLATRINVLRALLHLQIPSCRAAAGWWCRSRHRACVPVVSGCLSRRASASSFSRSAQEFAFVRGVNCEPFAIKSIVAQRKGPQLKLLDSISRRKHNMTLDWEHVHADSSVAQPAHPRLLLGERGFLAGAAAVAQAPPALNDTPHRAEAHGHCPMGVV